MRRLPLLLIPAVLLAQGTVPKAKPEDYEVHGQAKSAAVGAEYMVHSFEGQGVTYLAPEYLVVEVALYPPRGETIEVSTGAFGLRVNGKKTMMAAPVNLVEASLKHPEWRAPPRLEAGAGVNDSTVILGAPRPTQGPYPSPTPKPPPQPDGDPYGVAKAPRPAVEEVLAATALPEGKAHAPVSGFVYFPYNGKASGIKTVELLFEDAAMKLK